MTYSHRADIGDADSHLMEGLDWLRDHADPAARELAAKNLAFLEGRLTIVPKNFRTVGELEGPIDGLLLDIGVSSMQLDTAERGMSFSKEGPLDMRMDPSSPLTAEEIVNRWSREELERIFWEYGEVRGSRRFARTLCEAREKRPIKTTTELTEIISGAAALE